MAQAQKKTRAERNNNPGNIVKTPIKWKGEIEGDDPRFESFEKPEDGIRAIVKLLRSYVRQGFRTPYQIINRYAPKHENPTMAYAELVAKSIGKGVHDNVSLNNLNEVKGMVLAIIKMESGRVIHDEDVIMRGIQAGLKDD